MGLLHKGLTLLHFDETYFNQPQLLGYVHEDLDLRKLEHVNLYCEQGSLQTIQKRLGKRNMKGITYIGSGNYHYVSYLLFKGDQKPIYLTIV